MEKPLLGTANEGSLKFYLYKEAPEATLPLLRGICVRSPKVFRPAAAGVVKGQWILGSHRRALRSFAMEIKIKNPIAKEFQLHAKDTGSADVQIALLTDHINQLTNHLQKNNKDHSSRHGLLRLVSQRRSLLDYLNKTDSDRYQKALKKLNLRK